MEKHTRKRIGEQHAIALQLKTRVSCGNCSFLLSGITRNGMKPRCEKDVLKFKERTRIDYQNDADLRDNSCKSFKSVASD